MAKMQIIGTQMDLDKGPRDMTLDSFGGGTVQFTGSEAGLSHATTPMYSDPHRGVRGGEYETFASQVPLDHTPQYGWGGDTPMSDNSLGAMERKSGYPTAGNRKGR